MVFNVVVPLFSSKELLEGDGDTLRVRNRFDKYPIRDVLRSDFYCFVQLAGMPDCVANTKVCTLLARHTGLHRNSLW